MTAASIDVDTAIRLARHTALMPEPMHHETEQVLAAEVVRQRKIIAQYRNEVAVANRELQLLGFGPVEFPDGWPTCAGVKA
jgi:hypothetical protein